MCCAARSSAGRQRTVMITLLSSGGPECPLVRRSVVSAVKVSSGELALLRAEVGLADAIVVAARKQRDEAAARPASEPGARSLYEGCCAALALRETRAAELRAKLIKAEPFEVVVRGGDA